MAPEWPYPQPTEDCYAVTKYVLANPNEFNADIDRYVSILFNGGYSIFEQNTLNLLN
jgi:hypothetical protein